MKKKIGSDTLSNIEAVGMGIFAILGWLYGHKNGIQGEGMRLTLGFGIIFTSIGLIGFVITHFLKNKPLKSMGVINKDDELFVLIRAKAANTAMKILNYIIFIFIILTATDVVVINIKIYYLGIILFVLTNVLTLIATSIHSYRDM